MLSFSSKDAGVIKSNGKEVKHGTMGIHSVVEQPNSGDKKIIFENKGKLEGGFTIPAPKSNIKLISINGQKSNLGLLFTLSRNIGIIFSNLSMLVA